MQVKDYKVNYLKSFLMKKPLHINNSITMNSSIFEGRAKYGNMFLRLLFFAAFCLSGTVAFGQTPTPNIGAAKRVLSVSSPSSGTLGNLNVAYEVRIQNTGDGTIDSVQAIDNLSDVAQMGPAFVNVTDQPVVVSQSPGRNHQANILFDGSAVPELLLANDSLLPGESVVISFTVEVNLNAATGDLANQVLATATADSVIVSDLSDTGMDPVGTNPFEYGDTGGSDDPTLLPNCWEDCSLACNNLVYVAVNNMCEAEIVSEMILEGEDELCSDLGFFNVTIRDQAGNVIPSDMINGSHIGLKLSVTVTDIVCGNSCWGNIIIEDKAAPVLNCTSDTIRCNENLSPYNIGFPVDVNSISPTNDPRRFEASDIDACGPVELSYSDSTVSLGCSDTLLSSIVYRRWKAIDASGFEAVCYDTIYLIRGTFADLTLPPHWDGTDNPPLDCAGRDIEWPTFPNGNPDTSYTGKPEGVFCGNIQFDFQDDTIQVCGPTYKILRNWIILDWCDPSNKLFYTQRIKIEDFTAPIAICPPIDTVSTEAYTCTATARVEPPFVIEECSDWSYTILHKPSDSSGNPDPSGATNRNVVLGTDGYYYINDLPYGRSWIVYYVTDECGNTTECVTEIDVLDQVKPVPVCHKHTVVSLTSGGTAKVHANVLDDGSYDNCNLDRFEARRLVMGDCPTGINNSTTFNEYLEFCCNDIDNNPVMVEMRVYDESGNYSNCKVEVIVQDKIPPHVSCPPHITVSCEFDRTDLNVFGTIRENEDDRESIILNDPGNTSVSQPRNWGRDGLAGDNCYVEVTETVNDNLSDCGVGTITRTFRVQDAGGLTVSCQQRITVQDFDPLTINDIIWPADVEIFGCQNQTDPDSTGKPIITGLDDCNLVAANYEDEVFNFVEGACYKILRKWTVIDWCAYPVGSGYWQHTQVIKIINSDAPVFTSSCDEQEFCIDNTSCNARITLSATAVDDCTPQNQLIYNYRVDLDNDGTFEISGRGSSFSRFFTVGTHFIEWTVEDQCGNISECSYIIYVNDCKAPTPYCRSGLVTVLMPSTGTVGIWASDFNVNSEDNCTAKEDLIFSFSSDTADKELVLTCADIENGIADTITVEVWVTDQFGNQDFCRTVLVLQDNQDVCPDNVPVTNAMIAGSVKHYENYELSDVKVNMSNNTMTQPMFNMTSSSGKYAFADLKMHENYEVLPSKNDDPLAGVSTRDLITIQRHLLGIESLTIPYQLIAADVNNSGGISAKDLLDLRKLILGLSTEFPNNESWRFVNSDYTFPDPQNPWNFEEERAYVDLSSDEMHADFIGVKIGDVNGSVINELTGGIESRSRNSLPLLTKLKENQISRMKYIDVFTEHALPMAGMQMTIQFDPTVFRYENIQAGSIALSADMINDLRANQGRISICWSGPENIEIDTEQPLFTIVGTSFDEKVLNAFRLDESGLSPEAYNVAGDTYTLELQRSMDLSSKFELFQNIPNPFNDVTHIRFSTPIRDEAVLSIYDVSGRVIFKKVIDAEEGLNEITITEDELGANGVLYYRVESSGFTATKRMILIQ